MKSEVRHNSEVAIRIKIKLKKKKYLQSTLKQHFREEK